MTDERQCKAGDYAALDEPGGWRVLCNRRFPGDRYCDTVLAMIEEQGLGDGRRHRVLYFTHPAWIERHGVWRVATGAKKRHRAGVGPDAAGHRGVPAVRAQARLARGAAGRPGPGAAPGHPAALAVKDQGSRKACLNEPAAV